ncbi:hypothetical protein IIE18_16235 [Pseudomonas sp. V1]|uniref:hypothetical protein n=1 Tax=Pseudomonas arcuscaelestis TaxID=2710591 RepID=UPI00193F520D|nr:hypothetical protein [Pseudomonas arcuscaelestis]MBM3106679.1 hypothetical protein [Pseudomonas arcuscaelestis]
MLKNSLRRSARWVHLLRETLTSLLLILFFAKKTGARILAKQCSGKKIIYLVGNGPSAKTDLPALISLRQDADSGVCVVNNFAVTPEFLVLRPEMYVLADPNYWLEGSSSEIELMRAAFIARINSDVNWDMVLYLPFDSLGSQFVSRINSLFVKIAYYNRVPVSGFSSFCFFAFSKGLGICPAFNVLIPALHICIEQGSSIIKIIGADHSWHESLVVSECGETLVEQKHFYEEKTAAVTVKKPVGTFSIGELFVRWGEVFLVYHRISTYADNKNVKIINSSSKSYIDAFERQALDEVVR